MCYGFQVEITPGKFEHNWSCADGGWNGLCFTIGNRAWEIMNGGKKDQALMQVLSLYLNSELASASVSADGADAF